MCTADHEHRAEVFKNAKFGVTPETNEVTRRFPYDGLHGRVGIT